MHHFFLSMALIVSGGILPLFFWRHFVLMKTVAVAAIVAGCFIGIVGAGGVLIAPMSPERVFASSLNGIAVSFRIDPLAGFFLVVIFAVSALAAVYSFHYMDNNEKSLRTAANYLFFSLLVASMAMVVAADNMIAFMLCWELMSLSSFFLVIYHYESEENRKAGYLYFSFSQAGALLVFAAFGLIYAHTGEFGFVGADTLPRMAKIMVFVLAFIGFGSKAGVFPFHVWLPHAHPAAPSHISAVMSGVMIKTGIYGCLRIYSMLDWHTPMFGYIVLGAGMVSGVLGVVYALGQHNLKRLLAYHSVENIGIILIGVGIGMIGMAVGKPAMAALGFAGGLLHVLNHAVFKSLLFMGAGMVLHQTGTSTIDALGGLIKKMKITGVTFLVGSLAISGLPPFNGFVSELLIYIGGFQGVRLSGTEFAMSSLAIISLAVIGGLALACFTKVVGVVFQGEPRSAPAGNASEGGRTMLAPMIILAAACLIIGVFPGLFAIMAARASSSLMTGVTVIPFAPFLTLSANISLGAGLFLILLLSLLALRHFLYKGKTVTRSATWGCGFTRPTVKMQYTGSSYAASILEFFRPVAPLVEDHAPVKGRFPETTRYRSHIDDIAERHMNRVAVRPILALFDKLRWLQHGDIHLYIGYILLAIIVLLLFV